MGCGDMPHINKCYCRNSYKRKKTIKLSTLYHIARILLFIAVTILLGLFIHLMLIHFIVGIGSLSGEPVRGLNETKPTEEYKQAIVEYEFQIEPVKVERPKVGCEYWDNYINTLDATEEEKSWLSRIAFCESTCNPNAVSSAGATGLMQFMPKTFNWMGGKDINNSYEQIELALKMYRKGMRGHWCCDRLI